MDHFFDLLNFCGRGLGPVIGELLKRWTVRRLDSQAALAATRAAAPAP